MISGDMESHTEHEHWEYGFRTAAARLSGMMKPVIRIPRGNEPRFKPVEAAMRKHRDFENLPSFQRHA
jgi:hypothetical protein